MSFSDLLMNYIGRNVEVFLSNQYYEGELLSAVEFSLVIRSSASSYYIPPVDITVFIAHVQFLRIIS